MPTQGPFQRGNSNISVAGSAIFALGRVADAPLQYLMFSQGWAAMTLGALGLRINNDVVTSGPGIAGLGPIPTLLTGMYAIAGLRHVYWAVFIITTSCSPASAFQIAVYNATINLINTLVAVAILSSTPPPVPVSITGNFGWKQWAGLILFAVGILFEMLAEGSRKEFRANPRTKGKLDDTRLWSVVRHPNYLGYLLWRIGLALTAGSLISTVVLNTIQFSIFYFKGIPDITGYMETKYGKQWEAYKKRVPSAMIPFLL
ncbi:S5A-reductase domain-containing protein [Favolaschia claudopus]|uniref:S5A-reductase domain-containing protein n=1 Tax=Favolaschia claudopus TaxID=2862362 RepID=A0AAW0CLZ1_9AGAR